MKNINITGETKICGVIGDPISHTLSPVMQNTAFREVGLNYVYLPFNVTKNNLGKAVEGFRALNVAGVNVTIPHKVAVMPLLDEVDSLAQHIGAVNTIVNRDGILKGYNTDALGFFQVLQDRKITVSKKKVVVLGAGGAARAIVFILADKGAELTVLNRSLSAAEDVSQRVFQIFRQEVKTGELSQSDLRPALDDADLLVNTTSLGMSPQEGETPVPVRLLKKGLVVFDIIYNPTRTRLMKEAEKKGAVVIGGLDMLVRQGAASFELWTGKKAPVDIMKKAVCEVLNINED
jgi:shikimate dehydrogenase